MYDTCIIDFSTWVLRVGSSYRGVGMALDTRMQCTSLLFSFVYPFNSQFLLVLRTILISASGDNLNRPNCSSPILVHRACLRACERTRRITPTRHDYSTSPPIQDHKTTHEPAKAHDPESNTHLSLHNSASLDIWAVLWRLLDCNVSIRSMDMNAPQHDRIKRLWPRGMESTPSLFTYLSISYPSEDTRLAPLDLRQLGLRQARGRASERHL